MQLVHLILYLDEYQAQRAFGLLCLIFLGFRYSGIARAALKSQQLLWIVVALGLVLTLTYALGVSLYLLYPNYIDHFEATVSAISWLGTHGHPIYPNWRTGDIYEAPYGPLLFITNGTILRLFPTIFGSKLAGWTAFLIALALTYTALKARASDRKVVFLFLIVVIAEFSFFHGPAYAFWSRAEPFLILIGVLTIIAALKLPTAAAAITIGTLAGLAVGFKLHGALYAVPAALAICGTEETWSDRIGLATLLCIAAAVAVGLPFFAGFGANVEGYMSVLLMTAQHGLSLVYLKNNLLFALMLVTPITFAWYFRRPTMGTFDSWFLGGLFVSLAITTIIASKPGAGEHHLLPFVPISVYGLLSVLEAPTSRPASELNARELGTMVLVPLLVFYAPGELLWTKRFVSVYATLQSEKRKIDELQALYRQYPLAEVGLSDQDHYSDTFYKALLVFHGAPLHIDFASWMDLEYAGASETRIVGLLEQCDIPVWVLPEGVPFAMINWYTKLPLFSDDFRRTFFAKYKLIQKGEYYRVWRC
jgi:hypothetical protein